MTRWQPSIEDCHHCSIFTPNCFVSYFFHLKSLRIPTGYNMNQPLATSLKKNAPFPKPPKTTTKSPLQNLALSYLFTRILQARSQIFHGKGAMAQDALQRSGRAVMKSKETIVLVSVYNQQFQGTVLLMVGLTSRVGIAV